MKFGRRQPPPGRSDWRALLQPSVTGVAMLGPSGLAALVGIPAAIFAVLLPFRSTERYGMIAVDGALLLGALAAIALSLLAIAE